MWSPTHVQVTVCRVRGLITKGKNGTNDAFVTIALGKEKFQTSVKQKATPDQEWQEECELPIPTQGNTAEVVLTALHQNFIGVDEFLGMVTLPLSNFDVYQQPKSKWYPLKSKPGHEGKNKNRGEIEVRIAFTVKSGSLLDLSKKEKHRGSFGQLGQAAQSLGGSLLSLRGKDKKGIKKLASSVGHKLKLPGRHSNKEDKNEDPRLSRHSSGRFSDKFSSGEPDPGVISEDDDEFRFDELSHKSSGSSLNLAGSHASDSLENLGGGEILRRNSMGRTATLPNRLSSSSSSSLNQNRNQPSGTKSGVQEDSGNDWNQKLFGKQSKAFSPFKEEESLIGGVPSIVIQDSFTVPTEEEPSDFSISRQNDKSKKHVVAVNTQSKTESSPPNSAGNRWQPPVTYEAQSVPVEPTPTVVQVVHSPPKPHQRKELSGQAGEEDDPSARMPFTPSKPVESVAPSHTEPQPPVPKPRHFGRSSPASTSPAAEAIQDRVVSDDSSLDSTSSEEAHFPVLEHSHQEQVVVVSHSNQSGADPIDDEVQILDTTNPFSEEDSVCLLLEKVIEEHEESESEKNVSVVRIGQDSPPLEAKNRSIILEPVCIELNSSSPQVVDLVTEDVANQSADDVLELYNEEVVWTDGGSAFLYEPEDIQNKKRISLTPVLKTMVLQTPDTGLVSELSSAIDELDEIKPVQMVHVVQLNTEEASPTEQRAEFFTKEEISPVERTGQVPEYTTPPDVPGRVASARYRQDRFYSLFSTPNSEPERANDSLGVDALNWSDSTAPEISKSEGFVGSELLSNSASWPDQSTKADSLVAQKLAPTKSNPLEHSATSMLSKTDLSWDNYDMRLVTPPEDGAPKRRDELPGIEEESISRKKISLAPSLKTLVLDTAASESASDLDSPPIMEQADTESHRQKMAASFHQRVVVGEEVSSGSNNDYSPNNNSQSTPRKSGRDLQHQYQGKTREELIGLLQTRDSEVKDLKEYIDSLLLRVIETCPTVLQTPDRKSKK